MIVRRATLDDLDALVRLLAQLFAIEGDFSVDAARQARGLRRLLAADAVVLVGELDGRVAGMVTLQFVISTAEGGLSAWLEDMVVDAAARGSGLGSRLLQDAVAIARERGCTRVQLLADEHNAPALAFYRARGFTTTALRAWRRTP